MFKQFTAAALAISISTGALAGEAFTIKEFLALSPDTQKNFITTTAGATGLVANMNRPAQSKCIDAWIAKNASTGYQPVIEAMKKMPDYHPMAVTVAVIQKECGPFTYATASAALP
jgi:NAD/NADP transhydrogenase alpha subunit